MLWRWGILVVGLLFGAGAQASTEIDFYLQPHETAGTECQHKPSGQPHGYLVSCGERKFAVHHFLRSYLRNNEWSWQVVYWVTVLHPGSASEYVGSTLWLEQKPGADPQSLKLSQAIDQDTATLDLRIRWPKK